jgi:ATP-dependent DNA helicase DinG
MSRKKKTQETKPTVSSPAAEDISSIFGPEGRIFTVIASPEFRPGQKEMAERARDFFDSGGFAVIEAGTGVGKSLAYLVPAVLSGKKTIVATATKNLQDQLLDQDIPMLKSLTGANPSVALLKGRRNYLCLRKYRALSRQRSLFAESGELLSEFLAWGSLTKTGDRAELSTLPENLPFWEEFSAHPDACLGGRCPVFSECFLVRARTRAAQSDLTVTNHHLLLTDLALRGQFSTGLLPEVDFLILDEAHNLEEIASEILGLTFGQADLRRLLGQAQKIVLEKPDNLWGSILSRVESAWHNLSHIFPAEDFRRRLDQEKQAEMVKAEGQLLAEALRSLSSRVKILKVKPAAEEDLPLISEQAERTAIALETIVWREEPGQIFWAERRAQSLTLHATPVEISSELQEKLYPVYPNILFTSATLSTPGRNQADFSYFRSQLGLPEEIEAHSFPSPFDFQTQALLYLPQSMPEPNQPSYPEALAQEMEKLVQASRGRAFLLFTSFANLNYVATFLEGVIPFPILLQGEAPKSELLRLFKEKGNAVLLATYSFWEGVDVPGESLSLVVIDRLPFDVPSEPIIEARIEKIREDGGDPFSSYQLPSAVLLLRQGVGRLIRRKTDRGVIALLDPRLRTKGYGKIFLKSLPPMTAVNDVADVKKFFK